MSNYAAANYAPVNWAAGAVIGNAIRATVLILRAARQTGLIAITLRNTVLILDVP